MPRVVEGAHAGMLLARPTTPSSVPTRWLARARRNDPGVFTSEVGFDETKGYVQKVMSNYRVYQRLYTKDLERR